MIARLFYHGDNVYISLLCWETSRKQQFCVILMLASFFSGSEGLSYSVVEGPKKMLFHYDRMVPIEILQISLQQT